METTNVMKVACQKVKDNRIFDRFTTDQLGYFVILSTLANGEEIHPLAPSQAYEAINKEHNNVNGMEEGFDDACDARWEVLFCILNSSLFPIPEDWDDYIVERTEDVDYWINCVLNY